MVESADLGFVPAHARVDNNTRMARMVFFTRFLGF